jgi:hypothetical protein
MRGLGYAWYFLFLFLFLFFFLKKLMRGTRRQASDLLFLYDEMT